jgi:hypothetical protein
VHHFSFFLLCSLTPIAADPHAVAAQQNVAAFIEDRMRELQIPGLSLAVIRNGKIVKEKGYGLADVEANTSATPQTFTSCGSCWSEKIVTRLSTIFSPSLLPPPFLAKRCVLRRTRGGFFHYREHVAAQTPF